jgi:hypothetical protein
MQHACRFMHAGSCMAVYACGFMPAAADASVRTACVLNLVLEYYRTVKNAGSI